MRTHEYMIVKLALRNAEVMVVGSENIEKAKMIEEKHRRGLISESEHDRVLLTLGNF